MKYFWAALAGLVTAVAMFLGVPIANAPQPAPTASPTPSVPTSTPAPTPPPRPILSAPETAIVGIPFQVEYCQPYQANTRLYIDAYFLGTMGHDNKTGCMVLSVVLNRPGSRVLKVGELSRPIEVK
jgi:hypothetical protein